MIEPWIPPVTSPMLIPLFRLSGSGGGLSDIYIILVSTLRDTLDGIVLMFLVAHIPCLAPTATTCLPRVRPPRLSPLTALICQLGASPRWPLRRSSGRGSSPHPRCD